MVKSSAYDIEKLLKQHGMSLNYCPVPFTSLILEPDGGIGFCRQKGTDFVVGNVLTSSIKDIWHGDKFQSIRKELLSGEIKSCIKEISCSGCNLCSDFYLLAPLNELNCLEPTKILKITLNFSGNCNLRCQMCNIWKTPSINYFKHPVWNELQNEVLPFVKEIDMLSGEPFIQWQTYKLIDFVSEINPDCLWSFTTNGNWKFNKIIKEKLNKIKIKNVIFSIDSLIPEVYSKIRKRGSLSKLFDLIKQFIRFGENKNIRFAVNFCIQKDNWRELPNILKYCEDNDFSFCLNLLHEPEEFSLTSLNDDDLEKTLLMIIKAVSYRQLLLLKPMLLYLNNRLDIQKRKLVIFEIMNKSVVV